MQMDTELFGMDFSHIIWKSLQIWEVCMFGLKYAVSAGHVCYISIFTLELFVELFHFGCQVTEESQIMQRRINWQFFMMHKYRNVQIAGDRSIWCCWTFPWLNQWTSTCRSKSLWTASTSWSRDLNKWCCSPFTCIELTILVTSIITWAKFTTLLARPC